MVEAEFVPGRTIAENCTEILCEVYVRFAENRVIIVSYAVIGDTDYAVRNACQQSRQIALIPLVRVGVEIIGADDIVDQSALG